MSNIEITDNVYGTVPPNYHRKIAIKTQNKITLDRIIDMFSEYEDKKLLEIRTMILGTLEDAWTVKIRFTVTSKKLIKEIDSKLQTL